MDTKITREVLESYLTCKHKGHLRLMGEQGSTSDYELLQRESTNQVRLAATDKLVARHPEGDVVRGIALTLTTLKRGVPLLLNTALNNQRLSVGFDALQREAGPSRLGDFHYLPV